MAKLSRKKQDELIQAEIKRLNSIFEVLPEKKRELASELIKRVAFMTLSLEELENTLKVKGRTYTLKQGNQSIPVEHPAQKSHNNTMNRYTAAYGKLFELYGKIEPKSKEDDDDEEM